MIPESSHPTPTSPRCSHFMCSLPLQNCPASVFFWLQEGSCHLRGTQVETSTITSTQLPSPAGPALTHFHHFPSPCWEACFGPSSLSQGSPLTPASLPIHSTVADECHFLLQSSDSITFQFRNSPSSLCPLPPHMIMFVCLCLLCLLLQGLSCLLPPHCNLPTHGLGLHHLYTHPHSNSWKTRPSFKGP